MPGRLDIVADETASGPRSLVQAGKTHGAERVLPAGSPRSLVMDVYITKLLLPSGSIAGALQRMKGTSRTIDTATVTMTAVLSYSRSPQGTGFPLCALTSYLHRARAG